MKALSKPQNYYCCENASLSFTLNSFIYEIVHLLFTSKHLAYLIASDFSLSLKQLFTKFLKNYYK